MKLLLAAALVVFGNPETPWYEADMAAFEAADKAAPPPKKPVVFIGSSSIRMWTTLAEDMKERHTGVVNRGFGGSHMAHCAAVIDRIVTPLEPNMVVVYAGDNDIADGETPEQVLSDAQALVKNVHAKNPSVPVLFISIKPSPARWKFASKIRRANFLLREFADRTPEVDFVDVYTDMLGADGKPRKELFGEDGLHMTREGYKIWSALVGPRIDPLYRLRS